MLLSIFVISTMHVAVANAVETLPDISAPTPSSSLAALTGQPLADSVIKNAWPNLPTAKQLWDSGKAKCWVDTSDSKAINPQIKNCTQIALSGFKGGQQTVPIIWLQYNSTIWIQAPISLLQNTSQIADFQRPSQTDSGGSSTWAIGLYANPTDIAGSSTVYGALSYGSWGTFSPGDGEGYVHWDILTVFDGTYYWQVSEATDADLGDVVTMQGWDTDGNMDYYVAYNATVTHGVFYGQYIRYNPQYSAWEFYFNFNLLGSRISDGETSMVVGNQPNAVFESNDYTEDDFSGVTSNFGTTYNWGNGTIDYLPAIGYLFDGRWQPYFPTDHVPAAYVYWGGSGCPSPFNWGCGVANDNPPTWITESSSTREQFTVTTGTRPAQNSTLWTGT